MAKLGIGHTKFYDDVKKGVLPKPVRLGGRAVGYIEDEIDAVIERLRSERDRADRDKSDRDRRNGKGTVSKQPPDPPDNDEDGEAPPPHWR